MPTLTAATRRAIYVIAAAAIVLLGIYGFVTAEQGAAWLTLIGAVIALFAPATALSHITPDPVPGEVVTDEAPEPGVVIASEPDPERENKGT